MYRLACAALLLCTTLGRVEASGLGELKAFSHFGAPLDAEIRLNLTGAPLDVKVSLGGFESYQRLGLTRPEVVDAITVGELKEDADGWRVPLTSDALVNELVLDLVVLMEQPGARQIRHYPVLLEFPSDQPVTTRREPGQERPARSAPTRASAGSREPATGDATRRYRVEKGDTLFAIARSITGREGMYAMADAIFEANPQAFIRGNRDLIRAGASLDIPLTGGARTRRGAARPAPSPAAEPETISVDRVELTEPPPTSELERSMSELAASDEAVFEASAEEARLQLAFSRAELETYRNENERLQERVDLLEERLADMQRLLDLRDGEAGSPQEAESGVARPADDDDDEDEASAGVIAADASTATPRTTPEAEPEPESTAGQEGRDRKDLILIFGGAIVVIAGFAVFSLYRRESDAREAAQRQLARNIEDDRLSLPDEL